MSARRSPSSAAAFLALVDPTLPPAIRRGKRRTALGGPTALVKAEWRDPDDVRPDAKRRPRTVTGWRCLCVLRRIQAAGGPIEDRHIHSADFLRQRVDLSVHGYSPTRDLLEAVHGAPGPRLGPSDGAVAQAMASHEVERALRPFTQTQRRMIGAIVLANHAVQAWAVSETLRLGRRVDAKGEQGKLIACLDILSKFLEADVEEADQRGRLPE